MKSHGFEEIDHTADLALRVRGEDFQDLLIQAALGLYALLNVKTEDDSSVEYSFCIEEDSREAMLVDFLNELLYLCEDGRQTFHTFSFKKENNKMLVHAQGEKVAAIERSIKAVTFHNLAIKEVQTELQTTVTFDV
jgi:SHS2 domain-containing protein